MKKNNLFNKVKCSGYLKRINDGKFIEVYKGDVDEAIYRNSNDENFEITSEACGDTDFLKTYYEVKEKNFKGFVVGFKTIILTAYLVADTDYDFIGREHLRIYKEPKERIECAIVYYSNNRKRYVPLGMFEEVRQ